VLLTPRLQPRPSALNPPVYPHPNPTLAKDFWNLFACYLRHVLPFGDADRWSPLSALLNASINTESRELVVIALLVSVAAEGVVNLEFNHLAQPTQDWKDVIESARKVLRRLKCVTPDFKRRAQGSLSNMAGARGADRLWELAKRGVITEAMFQTWQELRNVTAHAAVDPDSHDTQTLWRACDTVATMLHLLVFESIGYSGAYTDYATAGWPVQAFTHSRVKVPRS
jgi:hypothetical protein